ncbi:hypothetical protein [Erwinia sp. S38]|uniref:hypothetical protein n=1 Tax=Erwinia sp. S38 TaxID=2769338 RepID=UPI00190DE8EA|nr:hypothetical protein [Erwinia sp. S38]MBK0004253.1 hypothetical protein [Erwinia sp. S38]
MNDLKTIKVSSLGLRILLTLEELQGSGLSSVTLTPLFNKLERDYNKRIFRSNVRQCLQWLNSSGFIKSDYHCGTPSNISMTDAGYACLDYLQSPQGMKRMESINRNPEEPIILPFNTGTLLKPERLIHVAGEDYKACRADFIISKDGSTCLQFHNASGELWTLEGSPATVAGWYRAALSQGLAGGVQVNEGVTDKTDVVAVKK